MKTKIPILTLVIGLTAYALAHAAPSAGTAPAQAAPAPQIPGNTGQIIPAQNYNQTNLYTPRVSTNNINPADTNGPSGFSGNNGAASGNGMNGMTNANRFNPYATYTNPNSTYINPNSTNVSPGSLFTNPFATDINTGATNTNPNSTIHTNLL